MNDKPKISVSKDLAAKRRLLSRLIDPKSGGDDLNTDFQTVKSMLDFPDSVNDIEHRKKIFRQMYPTLRQRVYFNYGALGPLAESTIAAIHQTLLKLQHLGSFSAEARAESLLEFQKTRQALAGLLGTDSGNIVLTENTTTACNIVLWGLDWQTGDHLLVSDCENPSLMIAIESLRRRFKLDVEVIPLTELSDEEFLERIDGSLKAKTRLLILSHVLWNTGRLLPLEKIVRMCETNPHASQIRILADGAQTAGMMELDLASSQIDFYAFGGQKWLCGPEGTGGLYISRDAFEELQPTFTGWRGLSGGEEESNDLRLCPDARRFEIASSSTALQAGLRAALKCHADFAPTGWIYKHLLEISRDLWQKLQALSATGLPIQCLSDEAPESGLVSFKVGHGDPLDLVRFLATLGIETRFIPRPACIRVCVHYLTTTDEIDELVTGIKLFLKSGGWIDRFGRSDAETESIPTPLNRSLKNEKQEGFGQ